MSGRPCSALIALAVTLGLANVAEAQRATVSVEEWNRVSELRVPALTEPPVQTQQRDSLLNGALIGAAVAAGATALIFLDNECRDDPACYRAVAVYAGIGALVGMGIDALIHRNASTAPDPPAPPQHVVTVGPLLTAHRKGMRMTIGF